MPPLPRDSPEASFARSWTAFDGAPEAFLIWDARKMFTIVAAPAGADTSIDRNGLSVLWPHRRDPLVYLPALGPAIVAALRANAPSGSFDRPFDLDVATLTRLTLFKQPAPLRFWVSRSPDRITVACRAATSEEPHSSSPAPLPPWSASSKIFALFDPPRRCPHCDLPAGHYRLYENALICPACGRSQRVESDELSRATLSASPK